MKTERDDIKVMLDERDWDYGNFTDNSISIVTVFNQIRGKDLVKEDYALFMIIAKLVREANAHKMDNLDDIEGYARLWRDMTK